MSKVTSGGSTDVKEVTSPATTQSSVYFNDSLARMALLAYNGCTAVRDTKCASRLPLLLCSGTSDCDGSIVNGDAATDRRGAKKDATASASSDKKRRRIPLLQK
jgi:hypothetical protein